MWPSLPQLLVACALSVPASLSSLQLPWATATPWQLVPVVMGGGRLEVPPRSCLPGSDTAAFPGLDAYVTLLRRCWAQNPLDRPAIQEVAAELGRLLDSTA